jgi:hypothetical protein
VDHRLDRVEQIETCFEKNKKNISGEACFLEVKKTAPLIQSIGLTEKLNSLCFYDSSKFKNVKNCLNSTALFRDAENHDEAVFECYRQFQSVLNQKQCLAVSNYLKYPAKKEYLQNHCLTNSNN